MWVKLRGYRSGLLLLAALSAGCLGDTSGRPNEGVTTKGSDVAPSALSTAFPFTDVTAETGIDFIHRNGEEAKLYTMLESLGSGLAALDFDGDGQLDLFFAGGGYFEEKRIIPLASGLYQSRGNWRFTDVSQAAGGGFPAEHYSHGCFPADYNNDGFPDVLVTGYGGLQLWRNQGDGTFEEVHAAAGLTDQLWSTSAGWADIDGDGCLDLYVAHYLDWSFENDPFCRARGPDKREICPPREFQPLPDVCYRSNGDGTFRDVSAEVGVNPTGKGLGVLAADINLDGHIDIYVANDTIDNFLYLNDGQGKFEEVGLMSGVALDDRGVANGSMGIDLCDYNQDGLPDIWVANYERETFALYRNEGRGQFLHASKLTGITALGQLVVGFGTACMDFDRDADEDIVVACGHMLMYPTTTPRDQIGLMLENHNHHFKRVSYPEGHYFATPHQAKGLIAADLDNDGDVDLAVAHTNAPAALLRNDVTQGSWLAAQAGRHPLEPERNRCVARPANVGRRHAATDQGGRQLHVGPPFPSLLGLRREHRDRRT